MNKNVLVHLLAMRFGYKKCLILRTPLTGPDCRIELLKGSVSEVKDIFYRCPAISGGIEFSEIEFPEFQIALLDPWHSYEASLRDLRTIYELLPVGGALVCHDCWPREEITKPDGWDACMRGGEWSGETWKAWIDFAVQTNSPYWTVDADYGCGVIFKGPYEVAGRSVVPLELTYRFLAGEGHRFLNLIPPQVFIDGVRSGIIGPGVGS